MKLVLAVLTAIIFLYFALYIAGNLALYQTIHYFDKMMHFTGGVITCWIVWMYVSQFNKTRPQLNSIFWATLVVGILWEIAEYSSDFFLQGTIIPRYFGAGGPVDSVTDIATNLMGAFVLYGLIRKSHPLQGPDTQEPQTTLENKHY